MLKDAVHIISKPLSYIFNLSLENRVFPDFLKTAKVTSIYKKGLEDIQSRRLIRLLEKISHFKHVNCQHNAIADFMSRYPRDVQEMPDLPNNVPYKGQV